MTLPFSRGLNFTRWLEAASLNDIVFSRITENDFINVKKIGVDVIRLPVWMHRMVSSAPDYTLDKQLFNYLDQAVVWAEKHKLCLILDNHSFHPIEPTDPKIGSILIPVWTQIARHYKDRSKYILYEILNEPHHIDTKIWAPIQDKVVKAIRAIDQVHAIIVGGVNYNSIDELINLPVINSNNIIYTFHFYDPHVFTHQGETWGHPPNLRNLKGLPFPADAHSMPEIPSDLKGSWYERLIKESYSHIATSEALAAQLDKAVAFSRANGNIPLYCGEYGVHIPNAHHEDRVRWYTAVTRLLDERNIARTSWDYFGSFGILNEPRTGDFSRDLNKDIAKAMCFSV